MTLLRLPKDVILHDIAKILECHAIGFRFELHPKFYPQEISPRWGRHTLDTIVDRDVGLELQVFHYVFPGARVHSPKVRHPSFYRSDLIYGYYHKTDAYETE